MATSEWLREVEPAQPATEGKLEKSPVFRNRLAKDGYAVDLPEDVTTLYDSFRHAVEKHPENNCLGWRPIGTDGQAGPYQWMSYRTVMDQATQVASALRHCKVDPHGRVGVYSINCPEWMVTIQACNMQSLYCVPLYDTLGAGAVEFIVNHSETEVIFVDHRKVGELLEALPKCDKVRALVLFGTASEATKTDARKCGQQVYTWEEFLTLGAENPAKPTPPKPDDLCTIMYTSGTTDVPKGVMLTHGMVLNTIGAMEKAIKVAFELHTDDVIISYLPLAHIFDRVAEELFLSRGLSIGYWQGDVKKLMDDIVTLKPTMFPGVPRIFDRVYTGVENAINRASWLKRTLYRVGFNRKLYYLNQGYDHERASPLFDQLVFGKIRDRLGGRVRLIISGAAPLGKHVEDFLCVTMCCPVIQGYGLTETCAASFLAIPDGSMRGTVGVPLPALEMCLEAVPEIGYSPSAEPMRGELCLRGPTVFKGYYKRDDLTSANVDEDGWFHTGDIAEINSDSGSLRIIDRKKNIFKLAQGEYVAVEHVENVLGKCSLVDMIWVYGSSYQSSLVAVVVPNQPALLAWAASTAEGKDKSFEEVCHLASARAHVTEELKNTGKAAKLKGFEFVKGVILEPRPFDVERDLMTPSFKKKRPQLQKYYQAGIDELYKNMQPAA
eukprot:jgi/Mesvir1/502/Mv11370-RA.1